MQLFEYTTLSSNTSHVIQNFHERGIIAIRNVPGFVKAQEDFIESSQRFIDLSPEERTPYTPQDAYGRGWSYGIETLNSITDVYKGSYYATYPESHATAPNIWPEKAVPGFKENYLRLVEIIFRVGQELHSLLGMNVGELTSVARMLYYGPIDDPDAVEWCGEHRDHSLLTGLCAGAYFRKGHRVSKPAGSGLFIRGEEFSAPEDALLFQIGETAELITNGAVTATDHHVRKALGGYERYNLAVFIAPLSAYKIESTLTKYNDRFSLGMSYGEWNQRSYEKYNDTNPSLGDTLSP